MALKIETFNNRGWRPGNNVGGSTLFKALGHPLAVRKAAPIVETLQAAEALAVYDALGDAASVDAFYGLSAMAIAGVYVQQVEDVGRPVLGHEAMPVTALANCPADVVFVPAFDASRVVDHVRHLVSGHAKVLSLDDIRLPDAMLTDRRSYLNPLNFATNFGFLRDAGGRHTRITSVNYWGGYGANEPALWLCLFDERGDVLAEWEEPLAQPGSTIIIDSRDVRARFGLGDFTGSLFMHAVRIAGHDVVKYAVDTLGDDKTLSCTHDANAWPADLYAGLPAPATGERVALWIQNSHPIAIPSKAVGINLLGSQEVHWLEDEIPAFGTYALDVGALIPEAHWPEQLEVQAGRYFVRPRYEVVSEGGRSRIAHANVERTDLVPDPEIPTLEALMGKGYIMPLPVLPVDAFRSTALPTPMATCQRELPLSAVLYDGSGTEVAREYLGRVQRRESALIDIDGWLAQDDLELPAGYGHLEFVYDFRDGGEADGWLHAIGRYAQRASGHEAETSFGAHIYNTVLVYRGEPQSYAGQPPGLSTRLFLRLGRDGLDTQCHLIYPASTRWHEQSKTALLLHDGTGEEVAREEIHIPCGGSRHWRYHELFNRKTRGRAGDRAYVIVRDTTCRLFGFHGLVDGDRAFCLDHMFGF